MKLFGQLAQDTLPKNQTPVLINAIHAFSQIKFLEIPVMSDEVICPMCSGTKGIHSLIEPGKSSQKMWFCIDGQCLANYPKIQSQNSHENIIPRRALEWELFCESSELGDSSFQVAFEKIQQSNSKIQYLHRFAKNPNGLLIMQGSPGTGKTYAALALCELFTRISNSCVFISQKKMDFDFQQSFYNHNAYDNRNRLTNITLLIVDDLGLTKPSQGFLAYFKDILDARMQWSTRGTVITTNLEDDLLSDFAGDALADRIRTGQLFRFEGPSRRERVIL